MIKLKDILNETELSNSQGEQTDFKKGDLVKDINPDCPHHGSEGKVIKVSKEAITYEVTNNGSSYKEGDELEKTVEQMVKLKESVNEATAQTITGNKRFMKNVVLPMMRKAAITKVKAKEFPSGQTLQLTFSTDREKNKKLLDLLKKKAGKKGSMKRKKLNLTVKNEIKKTIQQLIKEAAPARPASKSEVRKMEIMAAGITHNMKKLATMFNKTHKVSTGNRVLYKTLKDWEQLTRDASMKYGGWFDFVKDSDYMDD